MKIESIAVVLDKPKNRPIAFARGLDLKKRSGAVLDCFAFTWNTVCETGAVFTANERRSIQKELYRSRTLEARHTLEDAGDEGAAANLKTVWCKDIATWTRRELTKNPRDVLVKTVHRSKTWLHTPLDWELLRTSPVPVLLTSDHNKRRSGRVLATIDLRHDDAKHRRLNTKVLNAARYFCELYDAEMHVVAVTPMSQILHDLEIIDERVLAKKVEAATREQREAMLAPYDVPPRRVHQPVGKVGPTVARVARQLKADLLVVGTSAHRVRQSLGLGNSAEQILTHAECDVLAIHP